MAERATDLELCLRLVRALLARKQVEIAPARTMVESALQSRHGRRAVRSALVVAAQALDTQDALSQLVLVAAARSAKALWREQLVYRSVLRRRAEHSAFERPHLNWCVDHARALIDRMSAEPAMIDETAEEPRDEAHEGIRVSGMWERPVVGWGEERPGVRRVQPRERLESGVRFSVALASGDDEG